MMIKYANDFDVSDGIDVELFNNNVLGLCLTFGPSAGTDINSVSELTLTWLKAGGGIHWFAQLVSHSLKPLGTGEITVDAGVLATAIQTKMNGLVSDNTVRWSVLFKIVDKLETQYFTSTIDVGRPFFRIGADGRLYYKGDRVL